MLKNQIIVNVSSSLFQRIEFWIAFFFIIRLIGITNPPLELNHNWRQVTGLMVTRNFLDVNNNILYPRIDDNHGNDGVIGMEFPLMNYIYFLVAKVFGYSHWYGRLINLIISSIGIFYFYKILKKKFDPKIALYSSILLLSSIWFSFSRKMMPDTFCISLMFMGLYYGFNYFEYGKLKNYFLFFFITALALLVKIPAGIYLILLFFYFVSKEFLITKKVFVAFSLIIILLCAFVWYFVWNPYLSQTFGLWYNKGVSFREGFLTISHNIGDVFKNFYFSSFHSYFSFCVFLFGLYIMFKKKNNYLILIFFSVFIVFLIYILKSGNHFLQNYYIIPFVPVMAVIGGFGLTQMRKKILVLLVLCACVIEGIANQQHDLFIKPSEKVFMRLETIADSISNHNDLIAINDNTGNPQRIYLTHRKGWLCSNVMLSDTAFISSIHKKGCRYVFVCKRDTLINVPYPKVYEDTDYDVFDISGRN